MSSIATFLDNSIVNNTLKLFLILYAGYIYKVDSTRLHKYLNNQIFSYIFIALIIYALSRKFWFSVLITAVFYTTFHLLYQIENNTTNKTTFNNQTKKVNFNTSPIVNEYELDDLYNLDEPNNVEANQELESNNSLDFSDNYGNSNVGENYGISNVGENYGISNAGENYGISNVGVGNNTNNNNYQQPTSEYDPGQEIKLNQANHLISQNTIQNSSLNTNLPSKFKQFVDLQTTPQNYSNPDVKFIDASLKKENVVPYDYKSNKHHTY
jgi:hypothetical protein